MSNEQVTLDIDEKNELLFKVVVECPENASITTKLVCEAGDISYAFKGKSTGENDVVAFQLPIMKGKINEGSFPTKIEVSVDDRVFVPISFDMTFKKTVSVQAEAISHSMKRIEENVVQKPKSVVSATLIQSKKQEQQKPKSVVKHNTITETRRTSNVTDELVDKILKNLTNKK